jgi:hypothetical protein
MTARALSETDPKALRVSTEFVSDEPEQNETRNE